MVILNPANHAQAAKRRPRGHEARCLLAFLLTCLLMAAPACSGEAAPDAGPPAPPPDPPVELDRTVRVLLADDLLQGILTLEEPFDILDPEDQTTLADDVPPRTLSVTFVDGGIHVPALDLTVDSEAIEIRPRGTLPVGVTLPEGSRRSYRGAFRFVRGSGRTGQLINVIDVEDYLPGVVAAELLGTFHEETFRAQAIIARTYAWYFMERRGEHAAWDLRATEGSQVYAGIEREDEVPPAARAVRDTRGVVSVWRAPDGDRIFCTFYSSTCGGSTQPAAPVMRMEEIPPLAGNVACTFCRISPNWRWEPVRKSKALVTERLRERYPRFADLGVIREIEVAEHTDQGRPVHLILRDGAGRAIRLEAENFRLGVDPTGRRIKSTFFTLIEENNAFVFADGRGFGHGVGLCQYGAEGMARLGATAPQILRYYYPGSRLVRAY